MDLVPFIAEPTDDGIIEDLSKTNSREGVKAVARALGACRSREVWARSQYAGKRTVPRSRSVVFHCRQ